MKTPPLCCGALATACLSVILLVPLQAQEATTAPATTPAGSAPAATPSAAAAPTTTPTPAATPPATKFQPGDTLIFRLAAQKADLEKALAALNLTAKPTHGGFVEKTIADVNIALADNDKAVSYVNAHPAINPVSAWHADDTMGGAMAKALPALPTSMGRNTRSGGVFSIAAAKGVDSHMTDAYIELGNAQREFANVYPEMKPYQIGDMGGYRDMIRDDLAVAASDLIAGLDMARAPQKAAANGELVINGDFEKLPMPTNLPPARRGTLTLSDGNEPAGVGWRAVTVGSFQKGAAMIIHQGHENTAQGLKFDGPAADGQQWLDLAGGESSAIAQILPTTTGQQYTLTFAFANSPFPPFSSVGTPPPVHPNTATITIKDATTGADLVEPISITHETATVADYHWAKGGPIVFTAKSDHTTLQFTANYKPRTYDGVFLDSISVKATTAPAPAIPPASASATAPVAAPAPNPAQP